MSTRRVHAEAVILHKERLMNMQINVSIEEFTLRITYIYIFILAGFIASVHKVKR